MRPGAGFHLLRAADSTLPRGEGAALRLPSAQAAPRVRGIALALLLIAATARAAPHTLHAHVIGVHDGDVPSEVEGST